MIKLMQAFPSGAECARSRAQQYADSTFCSAPLASALLWTRRAALHCALKWNMRIGLSALNSHYNTLICSGLTRNPHGPEFPLCECYRQVSHSRDNKSTEHSRLSSKLLRKQSINSDEWTASATQPKMSVYSRTSTVTSRSFPFNTMFTFPP